MDTKPEDGYQSVSGDCDNSGTMSKATCGETYTVSMVSDLDASLIPRRRTGVPSVVASSNPVPRARTSRVTLKRWLDCVCVDLQALVDYGLIGEFDNRPFIKPHGCDFVWFHSPLGGGYIFASHDQILALPDPSDGSIRSPMSHVLDNEGIEFCFL